MKRRYARQYFGGITELGIDASITGTAGPLP